MKAKAVVYIPAVKRRNVFATDPLMRKGGPHTTSRKTQRRKSKQKFKADVARRTFEKVAMGDFLKGMTQIMPS